MQKCRVCGGDAVIKIDYANASFCKEHFISFYERKISKILKKADLRNKCILVAVSGGKDSVALLYALSKLRDIFGYKLKALHIDLGIDGYSEESRDISIEICERLGIPLIIYDVKKTFEWDIPTAVKTLRKPACSLCGLVKRWIMNKVALDEGCEWIATGHNVDDIDAIGLKSLLTFRPDDIIRFAGPILEPKLEINLVGRLRPQFFLTEIENLFYVQVNGLRAVFDTCPLAKRSTLFKYKSIWQTIDQINPVGKINFAKTLLEISNKVKIEELGLRKCEKCGQPTYGRRICSFCGLRIKIEEKIKV